MKVLSTIITTAVLSLTLITAADAMGRKDAPEYNLHLMKMSDTNKDGMVSKDEFMIMSAKIAAKEFMLMDIDDDGKLGQIEFGSGMR